MRLDFCPNCFERTTNGVCPNCDYNIAALEYSHIELKPGTVLAGKYMIGRVLGIGGFGITYMGYDREKGKRYAIKEYMPKDVALRQSNNRVEPNSPTNKDIYTKGLDMFLNETNVLITLSGSPGIVEAENFIAENNTGYLVMEYLDGISSKRLLANRGTLDSDFALEILLSVSRALRAVHSKGLLHRDISPENIMVLKNGDIKLIDFGAARFFVGERSKSLELVLKHGYAPPEQYSASGNQGEWTDIYALAASFYKLVTGNTLPDALSRANHDSVQRLDKINPQIKPYIGKAIQKALTLNYRDRYQHVDQFIRDLKWQVNDDIAAVQNTPVNVAQTSGQQAKQKSKKKPGFWSSLFGFSSVDNQSANTDTTTSQMMTQQLVRDEVYHPEPSMSYVAPTPQPVAAEPTASVRIVHGAIDLGSWELPPDREVYMGRDSAECYIAVRDSSVSRRHAIIKYNSAQRTFSVMDISTNGLFFTNGTRFETQRTYNLGAGDAVIISTPEYIMEMELK